MIQLRHARTTVKGDSMNPVRYPLELLKAVVIVLLFAGFAEAASSPPQTDALITAKAKLGLWTKAGIKSTDIEVDCANGKVTVHGTVRSEEQKRQALRLVR